MARPKKQVKLKEPIKIRLKSLADGNKSIYLDIYYKGVRKYEYLKLYLVPEINPVCKEQNKQTMAIAERIKAERIKALHGHGIQDWETVKQGSMLLTTWIRSIVKVVSASRSQHSIAVWKCCTPWRSILTRQTKASLPLKRSMRSSAVVM